MGRKTMFLLTAVAALALLFTACSTSGDGEDTANTSSSAASPQASESDEAACDGENATSASCEAAGPGTTVEAQRCSSSPPTPLEGGVIEGAFGPWCENAIATAYDTALIPAGAETELRIGTTAMDTSVELQVQGFAATTGYTAVLHNGACKADTSETGSEYVHEGSGDTPSAGLAVDFTTEADGSADSSVTVPWVLPDNGSGNSLVIQSQENQTAGCVTIP